MRTRAASLLHRMLVGAAVILLTACIWRTADQSPQSDVRLFLFGLYLPLGALGVWAILRFMDATRERERRLMARLEADKRDAEELCRRTIETLALAVEAKTGPNPGHLSRVAAYSVAIGRAMRMDEDILEGLRIAALLHDLGRLGIPDTLLTEEGDLTPEQLARVRDYPVIGARLLRNIPFGWPVVPIIRHHREHYDGTGYPDRLERDAIPIGSRVLAVADTFDVLVTGRPYRPGLSVEEALKRIEVGAGTQFDPSVVEAFLRCVHAATLTAAQSTDGVASQPGIDQIVRAREETRAMYELVCAVGSPMRTPAMLELVAWQVSALVSASACAIFLTCPDGKTMRALFARGINSSFLRGATAEIGSFLTGRVASRGIPTRATYLANDLTLTPSDELWQPFRSTLIVPLRGESAIVGTINLYHVQEDAFTEEDLHRLAMVGDLAGRAIENARTFESASEDAMTDSLTGLRNARYLQGFLDQELNRARKTKRGLAVILVDLDRFKAVNDTLGHACGDDLLRQVATLLRSALRNYDLAARIGGDEFVVVLPDADASQAEVVAAKLRDAVDRHVAMKRNADPDFPLVSLSAGVAVMPADGDTTEGLLAAADSRMYRDKRVKRAA